MDCKKCGGYIRKRDTFCPHCGMELTSPNYKPQQKNKNSEYKPLQGRFIRGEYQDREDDFYDQYIDNQYVDNDYYQEEKPNFQKPKKKKYRGYDLSEYYPDEEETENSGIGMAPIILILIIALLMGFIIGVAMYF